MRIKMAFRLVEKITSKEEGSFISGKDFFKKIRNDNDKSSPLKYDMDIFMLCTILGIRLDERKPLKDYKLGQPFSTKYIDTWISCKYLVTGLLVSKVLKIEKIDKNEKDKVKKILQEVIDTNDPTNLKPKYIELLHEYYLGGHWKLLEEFKYKIPDEVSVFFSKYNNLLIN